MSNQQRDLHSPAVRWPSRRDKRPGSATWKCPRAVSFFLALAGLSVCGCLLPINDPALIESSAHAGRDINDPWPGRIAALSSGPLSVLMYMVVVRPLRQRWRFKVSRNMPGVSIECGQPTDGKIGYR